VYKCDPTTTFFYSFIVTIRISGSYVNNIDSEYQYEIRRANGVTPVTSVQYVRLNNNPLVNVTVAIITTRVFPGGADPYQTEGFTIFVTKNNGPDFVIENLTQEIVFEAT
jgi:hypothetical protein